MVRYRADVGHDQKVLDAMEGNAPVVDEVKALLLAGRGSAIGPLMTHDFELRESVYAISEDGIREHLCFDDWLRDNRPAAVPAMEVVDTSHESFGDSPAKVREWIRSRRG